MSSPFYDRNNYYIDDSGRGYSTDQWVCPSVAELSNYFPDTFRASDPIYQSYILACQVFGGSSAVHISEDEQALIIDRMAFNAAR